MRLFGRLAAGTSGAFITHSPRQVNVQHTVLAVCQIQRPIAVVY